MLFCVFFFKFDLSVVLQIHKRYQKFVKKKLVIDYSIFNIEDFEYRLIVSSIIVLLHETRKLEMLLQTKTHNAYTHTHISVSYTHLDVYKRHMKSLS